MSMDPEPRPPLLQASAFVRLAVSLGLVAGLWACVLWAIR